MVWLGSLLWFCVVYTGAMFVIRVKLTFLLSVRPGKAAYAVNHTFLGTVLFLGFALLYRGLFMRECEPACCSLELPLVFWWLHCR